MSTTIKIELTPEELEQVRYALLELAGRRIEQLIYRGYDEDLRKEAEKLWKLAGMVFDALGYEYRVKPESRRVWVRFLNKKAFFVFGSEDEAKKASEEFPVCPPENEIVEFVEVMKL